MSDQTIFNQSNPSETQTPATTTTTQQDPYADLLKGIKNERGEQKYKTIQDALEGLQHAQNHIQTLMNEKHQTEQEVSTLRAATAKVTELERVVLELQKSNTSSTPASIDPAMVQTLVSQAMERTKQEDTSKQNLATVASAVQKSFGDKAEEVFYSKAQEVGLSRQAINSLAATSPAAALALIGLTVPAGTTSSAPTKTTINTTEMQPQQETFIRRNDRKLEVGASYHELNQEMDSARKMVQELEAKGLSVSDMTNPKNYFKHFAN